MAAIEEEVEEEEEEAVEDGGSWVDAERVRRSGETEDSARVSE